MDARRSELDNLVKLYVAGYYSVADGAGVKMTAGDISYWDGVIRGSYQKQKWQYIGTNLAEDCHLQGMSDMLK